MPGRLPSGRSSHHTDGAWFIAEGPGVGQGTLRSRHSVIDLMPTVLQHLDIVLPRGQGSVIDLRSPA